MLSSVRNSESAIEVNIAIMRAFVHLRKLASTYEIIERKLREIEDRIEDHDEKIEAIFEAIRQLTAPPDKDRRRPRIPFWNPRRGRPSKYLPYAFMEQGDAMFTLLNAEDI
jgi:thymidylate synthase